MIFQNMKSTHVCLLWGSFLLTLGLVGCGGASKKGEPEVSNLEKLKQLDQKVQDKLAQVKQPIIESDVVLTQLEEAPEKYKLKTADFKRLTLETFRGDELTFPDNMPKSARKELKTLLQRFKTVYTGLKATPKRSKELITLSTKASAESSVLYGKIKASDKAIQMAPSIAYSKKEKQASAKELKSADKITNRMKKYPKQFKKEMEEYGPKAKKSLKRSTKLFKSMGITNLKSLKKGSKRAVNSETKEARKAVNDVKGSAKTIKKETKKAKKEVKKAVK